MKALLIGVYLSLLGIFFTFAHELDAGAAYIAAGLVVWALRRDDE